MTIRVRDTGEVRDGASLYEVTEDEPVGRPANVAEITALEATEDKVLTVVQAMKDLARTEGQTTIDRAIAEVGQCVTSGAAAVVVDRVTAQKRIYTDALAAIGGLSP